MLYMGRKTKPIKKHKLDMLSTRVKSDIYSQVEAIAEINDLTVSQIVRRAVREFLSNHKNGAAEKVA